MGLFRLIHIYSKKRAKKNIFSKRFVVNNIETTAMVSVKTT